MSAMEKARQRGKRGFSLLELMVVVAILGVLATVAVPRFNIFRTRARQGEAKLNLDVIFKLQEAFKIEHERYYSGKKSEWGGVDMDEAGKRQGYGGGTTYRCETNKLGFRLAECNAARYGYYIAGSNETEFLAIAFGESSQVGNTRIYPGCDGSGAGKKVPDASPTHIQDPCSHTFGATNTSFTDGDAWCTDEQRNLENYRDIVEFCTE